MTESSNENFREAAVESNLSNVENLDAKIADIPISSGVLVVTDQNCRELNSTDISCIDPVEVLTVGNSYIVTHLKENRNICSPGTFLTLPVTNTGQKDFQSLEPPAKRMKTESEKEENLKKMLVAVQQSILGKLERIEKKLVKVSMRCRWLEEKVENILLRTKDSGLDNRLTLSARKGRLGSIIVGVPPQVSGSPDNMNAEEGSNVQLIALNSEADYPNGSWLGDPNNPDMRVRCSLTPTCLETLNTTCTTPEKMGLTLLDYLFDRQTQACSNISGTGKHGKKQLDPLKIYGIRCHLIYIFGTSDKDWHRIKQNLDSKCRTAFRRKQKGMPLTIKGFRDKVTHGYSECPIQEDKGSQTGLSTVTFSENSSHQSLLVPVSEAENLNIDQDIELNHTVPVTLHQTSGSLMPLPLQNIGESQIIHTEHGDIQVVHATPEQLAQIQQSHQIQILTGADVLSELKDQVSQGNSSQS